MFKFFVSVVLVLFSGMHPLHVSVCEVEYDAGSKALEIIQRIFLDDLEREIRLDLGQPELDITLPNNGLTLDQMAESYLQQHLAFKVNGKDVDYNYLGHEIEGDAILCYLEIEKIKKLKSISVSSSILVNIFDDQVNIVHVEVADKIRSMKLTQRHRSETFRYN